MSKVPKILVGCPTYSGHWYCLENWIKNVKAIDYHNLDILMVVNSESEDSNDNYADYIEGLGVKVLRGEYDDKPHVRIAKSRRLLYQYVIDNSYDYLFSVESDIFPESDVLRRLVDQDKDVIGAPYIVHCVTAENRRKVDWIVSMSDLSRTTVNEDGITKYMWLTGTEFSQIKEPIVRAHSCCLGATLIKREVLEQIPLSIDACQDTTDDSFFFARCFDKGIEVYVDSSLYGKVEHYRRLGQGFGWQKGVTGPAES